MKPKPKTKIVYKVLHKPRCSVLGEPRTIDSLMLNYPVNKIVKPKIGKIFCFNTKYNAAIFISKQELLTQCLTIHKSIAYNPKRCKIMSKWFEIDRFWNKLCTKKDCVKPPKGTLLCDALKCLE